jgi:hypothetical protein
MEQLRPEFADSIEEKTVVVMLHKRYLDCGVSDNLDSRRDDRVGIAPRGTDKNNGDGLVHQAYEQVLEIGRIFGKRLSRRDKGDSGRPGRLRL